MVEVFRVVLDFDDVGSVRSLEEAERYNQDFLNQLAVC
jgi:hypothetical protein